MKRIKIVDIKAMPGNQQVAATDTVFSDTTSISNTCVFVIVSVHG